MVCVVVGGNGGEGRGGAKRERSKRFFLHFRNENICFEKMKEFVSSRMLGYVFLQPNVIFEIGLCLCPRLCQVDNVKMIF